MQNQRRARSYLARLALLAIPAAALAAFGACGGDSDDPLPSAVATVAPEGTATAPDEPVGIIALGHSGLTGHNADTARPGEDAKEYSWATGTEPEVNSIYERLVASRPETEGHVFNAAVGGAVSDTLAEQAQEALAEVPAPQIAVILTIDNDIQCDGTDATHVPQFGDNVAEALGVIADASPETQILMVTFFGRPTPEDVGTIVAARPDLKEYVTGTGICYWYNSAGELVLENFATFNGIVDGYEAEQARVCAEVPQCATDDGAGTKFEDGISDYSDDFIHLNVTGLSRFAAHMWPVVEQLVEAAE